MCGKDRGVCRRALRCTLLDISLLLTLMSNLSHCDLVLTALHDVHNHMREPPRRPTCTPLGCSLNSPSRAACRRCRSIKLIPWTVLAWDVVHLSIVFPPQYRLFRKVVQLKTCGSVSVISRLRSAAWGLLFVPAAAKQGSGHHHSAFKSQHVPSPHLIKAHDRLSFLRCLHSAYPMARD